MTIKGTRPRVAWAEGYADGGVPQPVGAIAQTQAASFSGDELGRVADAAVQFYATPEKLERAKEDEMHDLGDVVVLKSGGPAMTVVEVEIDGDDERVQVVWWNAQRDEYEDAVFPVECVVAPDDEDDD